MHYLQSTPQQRIYVSLALDAQDYVHVVYDEAGGHLLAAYQDAGGWHFAVVNEDCWQASDPFLQLDAQGYEHVVYDCEYHSKIRYAYRDAQGWHDQQIFTLDDFADNGYFAQYIYTESLAMDSAGRPHAVVRAVIHKALVDIFYIYLDENGWQVELLAFAAAYGVVTLDAQDTVHAAYRNSDQSIYYATRDEQGWRPEFVAYADAMQVALALDSAGQPHIVNSGYGPIHYFWRDPGGAWQAETIPNWFLDDVEPRLLLDAWDTPHLCAQDNYQLSYSLREADTWRTRILAGSPGPPAMALDSRSGVHFAYRSGGNVFHLYPYPGPWFTTHLPAVFK